MGKVSGGREGHQDASSSFFMQFRSHTEGWNVKVLEVKRGEQLRAQLSTIPNWFE
jgi:hypothetical protein